MNIHIVSVGKLKEKWMKAAMNEFTKRLSSYTKLTMIEVADEQVPETLSAKEQEEAKEKEAERIMKQINERTHLITLEIEGKQHSSESFAKQLNHLSIHGKSHVTFVIGGSLGLAQTVLERSDAALSFSRMTFPHQLMRVILLEQIYRAFRINRGEPYHK